MAPKSGEKSRQGGGHGGGPPKKPNQPDKPHDPTPKGGKKKNQDSGQGGDGSRQSKQPAEAPTPIAEGSKKKSQGSGPGDGGSKGLNQPATAPTLIAEGSKKATQDNGKGGKGSKESKQPVKAPTPVPEGSKTRTERGFLGDPFNTTAETPRSQFSHTLSADDENSEEEVSEPACDEYAFALPYGKRFVMNDKAQWCPEDPMSISTGLFQQPSTKKAKVRPKAKGGKGNNNSFVEESSTTKGEKITTEDLVWAKGRPLASDLRWVGHLSPHCSTEIETRALQKQKYINYLKMIGFVVETSGEANSIHWDDLPEDVVDRTAWIQYHDKVRNFLDSDKAPQVLVINGNEKTDDIRSPVTMWTNAVTEASFTEVHSMYTQCYCALFPEGGADWIAMYLLRLLLERGVNDMPIPENIPEAPLNFNDTVGILEHCIRHQLESTNVIIILDSVSIKGGGEREQQSQTLFDRLYKLARSTGTKYNLKLVVTSPTTTEVARGVAAKATVNVPSKKQWKDTTVGRTPEQILNDPALDRVIAVTTRVREDMDNPRRQEFKRRREAFEKDYKLLQESSVVSENLKEKITELGDVAKDALALRTAEINFVLAMGYVKVTNRKPLDLALSSAPEHARQRGDLVANSWQMEEWYQKRNRVVVINGREEKDGNRSPVTIWGLHIYRYRRAMRDPQMLTVAWICAEYPNETPTNVVIALMGQLVEKSSVDLEIPRQEYLTGYKLAKTPGKLTDLVSILVQWIVLQVEHSDIVVLIDSITLYQDEKRAKEMRYILQQLAQLANLCDDGPFSFRLAVTSPTKTNILDNIAPTMVLDLPNIEQYKQMTTNVFEDTDS